MFSKNNNVNTIVYTTTDKLHKQALELGHIVLDIRTGMGHPAFALPKHIQYNYKLNGSGSETLINDYKAFLEESVVKHARVWRELVGLRSIAIFDAESAHSQAAHRMVFRHVLMNYLIDQGQSPMHGGEIYKDRYISPNTILYATA